MLRCAQITDDHAFNRSASEKIPYLDDGIVFRGVSACEEEEDALAGWGSFSSMGELWKTALFEAFPEMRIIYADVVIEETCVPQESALHLPVVWSRPCMDRGPFYHGMPRIGNLVPSSADVIRSVTRGLDFVKKIRSMRSSEKPGDSNAVAIYFVGEINSDDEYFGLFTNEKFLKIRPWIDGSYLVLDVSTSGVRSSSRTGQACPSMCWEHACMTQLTMPGLQSSQRTQRGTAMPLL